MSAFPPPRENWPSDTELRRRLTACIARGLTEEADVIAAALCDRMERLAERSRERADLALTSSLGDVLSEIEVRFDCTFTEDDRFRWSGQLVDDLMNRLAGKDGGS